jgi:hypothetical protein
VPVRKDSPGETPGVPRQDACAKACLRLKEKHGLQGRGDKVDLHAKNQPRAAGTKVPAVNDRTFI